MAELGEEEAMDAEPSPFVSRDEADLEGVFNSPDYDKDGVGLALSGGGYKAAAFHLGALIRLNELGYLPKIDRISSVSGGSITAGFLGMKWNELTFDAAGVAVDFVVKIVDPLYDFLTEVNLDVVDGILSVLLPIKSAASRVSDGYDAHLFKGATLQSLPSDDEGPRFVILATNYELNSLWRFARPYAADYRVGRVDNPQFSLAKIVAASSAFPPFFCPLELDFAGSTVLATPGADRHAGSYLERALLADGGVYDNMGLEPIWKRYGTLLVSNAGDPIDEEHPADWFSLLLRIIAMVHRQAENNRQRALMVLAKTGERKVAYWPLRNSNTNYPTQSPTVPPPADIAAAQAEKVRLWSLGAKSFARLANHGYSLCDSAMRSYAGLGPDVAVSKLPF